MWSTGQRVRITIHGAPLSLSLSLSLYSVSPPSFFLDSPSPPYTHIHTLSGTHTHKRGWAKPHEDKKVHMSTVHSFTPLVLPVAQTFSQLSKSLPVFRCSLLPSPLTEIWFIQWPAFTYGKRAVEGGTDSTLAQPAAPSSPWDFPKPSTDLRFVLTFSEITQV